MTDLDFKVMLAKDYHPKRVQSWKETFCEPKLDGVRVIVIAKSNKKPRYYTRSGRELGMFDHMNPGIRRLNERLAALDPALSKGLVFDTEAIGVTFGDVSGAIHTKGTVALSCQLHVFCVIPYAHFMRGIDVQPQLKRVQALRDVTTTEIKGISVPKPVRTLDHSQVMAEQVKHRRINPATGKPWYEGTMVKNLYVPWTASRGWHWMKIKEKETFEVTVTDLKEGKGKYKGMVGALICDYNGRKVRAGGMVDELRATWFKKPKTIIGKMIEVEAQEVTEAGSLRHIRFKRIRDDKQ